MTLCANPYTQGVHVYGCGRCMPCRIQRRRIWEHRISLETNLLPDNSFLTLTYSDQAMPVNGSGLGTLEPKHLQDWIKRLRLAYKIHISTLTSLRQQQSPSTNFDAQPLNNTLRYYAVGEYGDETFRPHYHAAIFGLPTCSRQLSPRSKPCSCTTCTMVRTTWGHGHIHVGNLEPASARYLAGYIEKKMTRTDDPRLAGRHPEFSRMSLKPGIGYNYMHEVASTLMQFNLEDTAQGDVPSSLRHGTRTLPLGRYLTRKLRSMVGKPEGAPDETIKARAEEMRPLQQAARNSSSHPSLKHQVTLENKAARLSQAAKSKLKKQRRTL